MQHPAKVYIGNGAWVRFPLLPPIIDNYMKRYQECNKIEKIWRKRWYLLIPFQWFWYSTVVKFKVYIDEIKDGELVDTGEYEIIRGKNLWSLLKGMAQSKMKWYYTMDEVKERCL